MLNIRINLLGLFRPLTLHLRRLTIRVISPCHLRLTRTLATVPSSGPDVNLVGQCNFDGNVETVQRRVPLAPTIHFANSSADELRQEFLHFFRLANHTQVAPATVFPKHHEGSYFVNAGMNQFKPLFLQQTDHSASDPFAQLQRATSAQPCIRVGGRLDDLNDVGYDRQHHTMFEMLGNWSFGDYYKAQACQYMWDFLTKVIGLPPNALYVTYFGGCPQHGLPPDDETRDIWLALGVLDQKLMPFGMEYNFWRAGLLSGAGLCGPCTEIHVDFRALADQEGLQCARCLVNTSSPQLIELWNCVFITHRLQPTADESFKSELLEPLSKPFVDTGMGLERLACVIQGVTSTYDTDVFVPLINLIHSEAATSSSSTSHEIKPYDGVFLSLSPHLSGELPTISAESNGTSVSSRLLSKLLKRLLNPSRIPMKSCPTDNHSEPPPNFTPGFLITEDKEDELVLQWHRDIAYRLLADHSRALAHALADGLLPGRQGLPLKLRQLIQRAVRAAVLTGIENEHSTSSILSSLVVEVAKKNNLMEAPVSSELHGPSARRPSSLSYEEMRSVIDREVHAFLPRIHDMELAFSRCIEETPNATHLSANQVDGLMHGKYGAKVSWDLLCAQSRWVGLNTPCPPTTPSQGFRSIPRRTLHPQPPISLARRLHDSRVPFTEDSAKYNCTRISDQSYVIPPSSSHLLCLIVPASNSGDYVVLSSEEDYESHTNSFGPISGQPCSLGFVFDSTNYFTTEGGQSGDVGSVSFGSMQFAIDSVQKIADPINPTSSWIVHWSILPEKFHFDAKLLWSDDIALLHVDNQHRFRLMQHHTGQHLFSWALDVYAHELRSSGLSATVQHHGGSVHPDKFVVNAAIMDPNSDASENLYQTVERLEAFCRKVIGDRLPVSVVSLPWNAIAENKRIRRFPWVNYPKEVRTVFIGDWNSASTESSATAELCSGTHLASTADLVDLAVIAVRARHQATKQFTAIVGEAARTAHRDGESLVAEALARESTASWTELPNHIDWLSSILHQANLNHTPIKPLSLIARVRLESCLHRMRTARMFIPSKPPSDEIATLVDRLSELLKCAQGSPLVSPVHFSRPDALAQAIVELNPPNPGIFYNATTAILFCPSVTNTPEFSPLNIARLLASRLYTSLQCGGSSNTSMIKSRPLRSNSLRETVHRFNFALLELDSSIGTSWNHHHNLLESHFKDALALSSSDTSDTLRKRS